jgi:cephalosporin hydroxylase
VNLYDYFLSQSGRKIIKQVHYFHIYERHLARFKHAPVLMFEVGTGEGGSAEMWKRYFGPLSRIVTIDIEDKYHVNGDQIYARQGDQADAEFLKSLVDEFGVPDIVLDDGSHIMRDVAATFETLYPLLRSGGVYLVEDMNAAYYPDYGGGLQHRDSFIERCKTLVDDMHAVHTNGAMTQTPFGAETFAITFYDMVVVLEKAIHANKNLLSRP